MKNEGINNLIKEVVKSDEVAHITMDDFMASKKSPFVVTLFEEAKNFFRSSFYFVKKAIENYSESSR